MIQYTDTLTRKAYAKINLGLDVIGRLENGYHQVRMIMQTVGIYDVLTFAPERRAVFGFPWTAGNCPQARII